MPAPTLLARVPTIDPRTALRPGVTVVDLRSPAEFALDHVPGAHSVPLFDDTERAVIGTLYKERSPQAAFERGSELAQARIASLVERVAEIADWEGPASDLRARVARWTADGMEALDGALEARPEPAPPADAVCFHCWRGGLRSRSVVAFLRALGMARAVALEGGYKAYRAHVREALDAWEAPPTVVLRGLTGVGKTLVLRAIEARRPGWTLDLEGLAQHRSSILGMVGLEPCSQKTFDSRLAERLARGFPGACVVEGESRKVGDVILPPRVWESVCDGTAIELVAPLERRVRVLIDDYLQRPEDKAELARQLVFIEARLGKRRFRGKLVELLESGREEELVALLLERYYDPLYRHSEAAHSYAARIDSSDPVRAAEACIAWIEARGGAGAQGASAGSRRSVETEA